MGKYDQVVVGAGIVGSWTALHLRNLGKNVLLLEQFSEPHSRGSSQGQSRIIRSGYAEEIFAKMMPHAFNLWDELQKECNQKLILKSGLLSIISNDDKYRKYISNMQRYNPQHFELLDSGRIPEKFSRFLHHDNPKNIFFDKSGGVVLAHKSLLAVQELFKKRGGQLWDNCKVSTILSEGENVTVSTSKGDVTASSVVVCAGPWTKRLLCPSLIPSLPLQPEMVKVYYWKVKEDGAYSYSSGFPAVRITGDFNLYSLPSYEYPDLVKVCLHGGVPCDPDERDRVSQDPKFETFLKESVAKHFPLLENEPAIIETCMYTSTPDEIFLVDRLPQYKNIILGSGFSGTGFKTSPVVGKLLSQMAVDEETFLDITPFRIDRISKE